MKHAADAGVQAVTTDRAVLVPDLLVALAEPDVNLARSNP